MTLTEGYNGYMAMVSDGKYVYVYVKMKYGQVPGYGDYNFDIGGQKYYVWSNEMPSSQSDGRSKLSHLRVVSTMRAISTGRSATGMFLKPVHIRLLNSEWT